MSRLNKISTLLIVFIFLLTTPTLAQSDSIISRSFRYYNPKDTFSIFLENQSRRLPSKDDTTYSITITVTNIRSNKGVIRFKFYDDNNPFQHDTGFLRITVPKSRMINGTLTVTYSGFMAGYMGIALHDDENSNMKLEFGWLFPEEGHAFSDYYHTALARPKYENFRFLLKGDKSVVMKMRYY